MYTNFDNGTQMASPKRFYYHLLSKYIFYYVVISFHLVPVIFFVFPFLGGGIGIWGLVVYPFFFFFFPWLIFSTVQEIRFHFSIRVSKSLI